MTDYQPQLLTIDGMKHAARLAFREGRLGFQRGHTFCRYDYGDGSVCAIGAVLSEETRNHPLFQNENMAVGRLGWLGLVTFGGSDDARNFAVKLQRLHDCASPGSNPLDAELRAIYADFIRQFCELIEVDPSTDPSGTYASYIAAS